jgi:hypothetical protein
MNIPHEIVKLYDGSLEPDITPPNPVIMMGSLGLRSVSDKRGWFPGHFHNENFDFSVWRVHYGEHLLNHDSFVCKFGEVTFQEKRFFARPTQDTKTFSGKIFDWAEFTEFQSQKHYTKLNSETLISISPIKEISQEYRFFVVDGEVLTGSQYKLNGKGYLSVYIDDDIFEFAQKMVSIWQPSRAFVIDVCRSAIGLKIVEFNTFNCSGIYLCDVQKIIMAIEEMKL